MFSWKHPIELKRYRKYLHGSCSTQIFSFPHLIFPCFCCLIVTQVFPSLVFSFWVDLFLFLFCLILFVIFLYDLIFFFWLNSVVVLNQALLSELILVSSSFSLVLNMDLFPSVVLKSWFWFVMIICWF